jgi:metal-responsive CopG/Arc/MetJ family transcriptional regulator
MKRAIQITIDEDLLRRIDADPEVKHGGRSGFIRRATEEYLRRKRQREIRDAYERGYAGGAPFPDDFGPWPPEAAPWPEE